MAASQLWNPGFHTRRPWGMQGRAGTLPLPVNCQHTKACQEEVAGLPGRLQQLRASGKHASLACDTVPGLKTAPGITYTCTGHVAGEQRTRGSAAGESAGRRRALSAPLPLRVGPTPTARRCPPHPS